MAIMTTQLKCALAAVALAAVAGTCRQARSDNTQPPKPATPGSGIRISAPPPAPVAANAEWESLAKSFDGCKADTKPSRDTTMQFSQSTEVREVLVRGGMHVKKGDPLIVARDADIIAAINQQKALAENEYEVRAAEIQREFAEFKFDRIKGSGTFTPTEYQDAWTGVLITRVQVDQAKKKLEQEQLHLKQLQATYERYRLEAPFDGIIEEVMVEVGQGVTEQEKVLRMVNTDKLWLDPYAPTGETIKRGLKEGSAAWVLVELPEPKVVRGTVVYVSPVADSVSQTRRVRVEIENPLGWPAGTQARVRFTEPSGDWEKYRAETKSTALNTIPLQVTTLLEDVTGGNCGIPCLLSLSRWMESGFVELEPGTPPRVTDRFRNAEVRQIIAQVQSDAESRTSLLAAGDAGSANDHFFVTGDGLWHNGGRYILTFPKTDDPGSSPK